MHHKIFEMKKVFIILALVLAVAATSCKKDGNEKSKSLTFNGNNPYTMALRDTIALPVSSDYDVTVTSANNNVVRPYHGSKVIGWNVGETSITISNGYESVNVDVNVDLFVEPTFEFGCSPSHIRSYYGSPFKSAYDDDGTLRYIYTSQHGYSWACGQMDFLFDNSQYIESQVYIKENMDYLLNNYITANFNFIDTVLVFNPFVEDSVDCCVYRNKIDETVLMGKFYTGNTWHETLLFYVPDTDKDVKLNSKIRIF